jgi:hypothetical protein
MRMTVDTTNWQGGAQDAQSAAEGVVNSRGSEIRQFIGAQRQACDAGIVDVHKRVLTLPDMDVFYQNHFGKETIHYVVRPQSAPASEETQQPASEEPPLPDAPPLPVLAPPAACAIALADGTILYAFSPEHWHVTRSPTGGTNPSLYFSAYEQKFYVIDDVGSASTIDFKSWKLDDIAPNTLHDEIAGLPLYNGEPISGAIVYDKKGNITTTLSAPIPTIFAGVPDPFYHPGVPGYDTPTGFHDPVLGNEFGLVDQAPFGTSGNHILMGAGTPIVDQGD